MPSGEKKYYAEVKWGTEDILYLRPNWTHKQAESFLSKHEGYLAGMISAEGFSVLRKLLGREEE